MAMRPLYATGSFRYKGQRYKTGDPVQMDEGDTRLYFHLGKIEEEKATVTPPPAKTVTKIKAATRKPRRKAK
jgi:hypothetical protein